MGGFGGGGGGGTLLWVITCGWAIRNADARDRCCGSGGVSALKSSSICLRTVMAIGYL